MIAMALVGAALGAVLSAIIVWLVPTRTSPLVQLGQLDARYRSTSTRTPAGLSGPTSPGIGTSASSLQTRVGQALATQLTRRGIEQTTLEQDLALTGQDLPEVMGRKAVLAVAGFLLTLVTFVALAATGVVLPLGSPLVLALAVAAGFYVLPNLDARQRAAARREDFRRALGAYLDLVALEMAGAAAPAQALTSAARVGAGWPMALLRDTLYRATRSGKDQWTALTELGERIGVAELRDLGALVRLVEHDGARVRATLSARAATMRRRELADAEGKAAERDVSMSVAQLVVVAGFVVFLGYPAVVNVLGI
jgi:tight adherence protein C